MLSATRVWMFELFKKPLAEADLKHIWLYSFRNWGETQADYYLQQLDAGLQRLVDNPKLGRPRDSIGPATAHFKSTATSPIIRYRTNGSKLFVYFMSA